MASPVPKARCGEYDFVEQPPEEYFCPVSFAVLLEPYQTQCCGNLLSKESYERLQGQPCPVCREENLTATKDKFHMRKVATLKVRCPHKAEGCEWEGELGSLEQHLNTNSSKQLCAEECQYVDVDCPHSCGERFKRHALQLHVKDCVSSMLAQEVPKLKVIVQEQSEQIKQQEDKIEQLENQIEQLEDQIEQQGGHQIEEKIKLLMKFNQLVVPPVDIVMDKFEKHKDNDSRWYSPPFYSLDGYKMSLSVCANGQGRGKGTHVSVFVCLMRGKFDDGLKWPFSGRITIKLKTTNPLEPQYSRVLGLDDHCDDKVVCKPKIYEEKNHGHGYPTFISHCDLYAGDYLRGDKLTFCITDITVY